MFHRLSSLVMLSLSMLSAHALTISDHDALYPPLWQHAPASLIDYPWETNDTASTSRLIDPWLYSHRLGLLKILINVTTPLMPFCSSSINSNVLFALPSQLGWLFHSNRLFNNDTEYISTDSWWASANYYISVVPFLVAADIGLIDQHAFRLVRQENFCSDIVECRTQVPDVVAQWHRFFHHLQQSNSCIANETVDERVIDKCYLAPMWSAYESSISHALPLVESKLELLPSEAERLFGQSWARLVHLIAMTRKSTNLMDTLQNQRQFLPFRLLTEADLPPRASDLPASVNRSLTFLFSFRFDWLSVVEKIWQRITCNYPARVNAQQTLDTMAVSRSEALHYLLKAAWSAFSNDCNDVS